MKRRFGLVWAHKAKLLFIKLNCCLNIYYKELCTVVSFPEHCVGIVSFAKTWLPYCKIFAQGQVDDDLCLLKSKVNPFHLFVSQKSLPNDDP